LVGIKRTQILRRRRLNPADLKGKAGRFLLAQKEERNYGAPGSTGSGGPGSTLKRKTIFQIKGEAFVRGHGGEGNSFRERSAGKRGFMTLLRQFFNREGDWAHSP